MRKVMSVLLVLLLGLVCFAGLTACADKTYEIALVIDLGDVDDASFNEGAWIAITQYATEHKITHAYYRSKNNTTESRTATLKEAIDNGAKLIVCPGYYFEKAIYNIQNDYPSVNFLMLDGEPNNGTDYATADNVHCILYREEQAGYLAGYAAVMDGYRKLGFLGGVSLAPVKRYGYGYIQGAEAAAINLGLADNAVEMNYWYAESFVESDEIKDKMITWYKNGYDIIFSCGGAIFNSVLKAAEGYDNAKLIGVDIDQSGVDAKVITSAVKGVKISVLQALNTYYDNNGSWTAPQAGKTVLLGVSDGCVFLPTWDDSWRFTNFSITEYEAVLAKLESGEINVSNASDTVPATTKINVHFLN